MNTRSLLVLVLAVLLILRFSLIFTLNIHWDEFFFLSRIYEFHRGELSAALQTFHVRLLEWIVYLPLQEVDQIITGRLVMFFLSLASALLIYSLARNWYSKEQSLLVLIGYQSLSEVMLHANNFRFDPLISLFYLFVLRIILKNEFKRNDLLLAGLLLALALLINLKSVLLFVHAVLFLLLLVPSKKRISRLSLLVLGSAVSALVVGFFHKHFLADGISADAPFAGVFTKALLSGISFAGLDTLEVSMARNPIFYAILFFGCYLFIRDLLAANKANGLRLLVYVSPLSLFLFYKNAHPYFIPTVYFTISLLLAEFVRRIPHLKYQQPVEILLAILLLFSAIRNYKDFRTWTNESQRRVIAEIHQLFPEPVSYIDRAGMVSSFKKVGPFMSRWEMEKYRSNAKPIFKKIIESVRPSFILVNTPALDLSAGNLTNDLLLEDRRILEQSYRKFSDCLYLSNEKFTQVQAARPYGSESAQSNFCVRWYY